MASPLRVMRISAGNGRTSIPSFFIEAKKSAKEADMDKLCDEALAKIIDKKYAEGLYGYKQVFCYGIAFFQKQAKVKGRLA